MSTTIRVVGTTLGYVAREFHPTGERAYRRTPEGAWHYCPDHKGPWVGVALAEVPDRVRAAIAYAMTKPEEE